MQKSLNNNNEALKTLIEAAYEDMENRIYYKSPYHDEIMKAAEKSDLSELKLRANFVKYIQRYIITAAFRADLREDTLHPNGEPKAFQPVREEFFQKEINKSLKLKDVFKYSADFENALKSKCDLLFDHLNESGWIGQQQAFWRYLNRDQKMGVLLDFCAKLDTHMAEHNLPKPNAIINFNKDSVANMLYAKHSPKDWRVEGTKNTIEIHPTFLDFPFNNILHIILHESIHALCNMAGEKGWKNIKNKDSEENADAFAADYNVAFHRKRYRLSAGTIAVTKLYANDSEENMCYAIDQAFKEKMLDKAPNYSNLALPEAKDPTPLEQHSSPADHQMC